MIVEKPMVLPEIWRTCEKIRAAIPRLGIDLWSLYKPLDPDDIGLMSAVKFVSVLNGQLKFAIGLSDKEVEELTYYFRAADSRVMYKQFCEVIHYNEPDMSVNPPMITGLECARDPLQCNPLGPKQEQHAQQLIGRIAAIVNERRLVLRPYFQNYTMLSKNSGVVTLPHLSRILHFLRIPISTDEYNLLVKKYIVDSYTFNYEAFVKHIGDAKRCLMNQGLLDVGGDMIPLHSAYTMPAHPDLDHVFAAAADNQTFHPSMASKPPPESLPMVTRRLQKYVLINRIRVGQFFEHFDERNSGRVTTSQFRRCLDGLGVARMDTSEAEVDMLVEAYRDPQDRGRVLWRQFEDDVDRVFAVKGLEKCPEHELVAPPPEVVQLQRKGAKDWTQVEADTRDLCEVTMERIRERVRKRGLLLWPSFSDYDKPRNGHVSRVQYRQCLLANTVVLAISELQALDLRFTDDLGFNYFEFFRELETEPLEPPKYEQFLHDARRVNAAPRPPPPRPCETDIVAVLGKIKSKAKRESIWPAEFLRGLDPHCCQHLAEADFERGLDACRFELTAAELRTVMDTFATPHLPGRVDYVHFCEEVAKPFTQSGLHELPVSDGEHNFLNFEERQIVSGAMQLLAQRRHMNLEYIFTDFDRQHCGKITRLQFVRGLVLRGMHHLMSGRALELVMKCYGVMRGSQEDVDYAGFLRGLATLQNMADQ